METGATHGGKVYLFSSCLATLFIARMMLHFSFLCLNSSTPEATRFRIMISRATSQAASRFKTEALPALVHIMKHSRALAYSSATQLTQTQPLQQVMKNFPPQTRQCKPFSLTWYHTAQATSRLREAMACTPRPREITRTRPHLPQLEVTPRLQSSSPKALKGRPLIVPRCRVVLLVCCCLRQFIYRMAVAQQPRSPRVVSFLV